MRAWWQRRPLRFRLALWYGLGGTLLLMAFSATIYSFVARRMARPLSHHLEQDLERIRAHLAVGADRRITWDGRPVPEANWDARNPWFELWDQDGNLVRRFWP